MTDGTERIPVPSPSGSRETVDWRAFGAAMLNATTNGVLATDNYGVAVLANRVAKATWNVHPGTHLKEAVPEIWPHVERTAADRTTRSGLLLTRGDESYLATISPLSVEKEFVGVLCVFTDSTELEATSRQLRSFQELTWEQDVIINSSSDGLWICDGKANVLRINPASERLNNIQASQVVGRNMTDLVEEGVFDRSATLAVLRTGKAVNMLQVREGRKLMLTGNPVFDDAGNLIRVVVNERDLTEVDTLQRELEEQEAISYQFRHQIREKQQEELESRRVIAKSPNMLKVLRQALKVCTVDSSVLILGESGVGKGLVADLIHKYSNRSEKPLIKINCGAIPESLIEAELFGYEKGAFTGAQSSGKPGYFELADGGILFLDEIAELPLSSQVKLLRFLEDGRVMRVGGTKSRTTDVRILAATQRDLGSMVEKGEFRLDLYYRLKVIPIHVPPLRERKECLLPLLRFYVDFFAAKIGTQKRLSRAASDLLLRYPYPGNVRELINLCERLVVMSDTKLIDLPDLPAEIVGIPPASSPPSGDGPLPATLSSAIESVERSILERARERYGNQSRIASVLGVNQATVARKMKKYGIR
jgi:PAS domain S-box-containing protein